MNWARLDGQVAVVTGGNDGIGLGFARGLAQAGASVAVLGRRADRNAAAAEQLPGDARPFTCDVADEDSVAAAFDAVVDAFGRIDSCFVNAGISGTAGPALAGTAGEWNNVLGVNLNGAFFTARAAADRIRQRGEGGSIVFTSSLAAFDASPFNAPYAASKAGVLALTRSLAGALARDRIRVNAIVPGWVETAMTEDAMGSDGADKILRRIPLHRWGAAEDFEGLAVLLAGSGSSYLTGQAVVVDGGYSVF